MLSMPRVTMNGCSLKRVIKNPLNSPTAAPTASPRGTVSTGGTPPLRKSATTIPPNPRVDPTERSIPPEAITKVIPRASIRVIVVLFRMFKMLYGVKKYGEATLKITHRASKVASTPRCDLSTREIRLPIIDPCSLSVPAESPSDPFAPPGPSVRACTLARIGKHLHGRAASDDKAALPSSRRERSVKTRSDIRRTAY